MWRSQTLFILSVHLLCMFLVLLTKIILMILNIVKGGARSFDMRNVTNGLYVIDFNDS